MKARFGMGIGLLGLILSGCLVGDPNPYANVVGSGGSDGVGAVQGLRSGEPSGTPIVAGAECSVSSSEPVNLILQNQSSTRNLTVYWVDFSCAENLSGSLPAMGTFQVQTYVGHPWRLRDDAGQLLYEYLPTNLEPQTVALP